MKKTIVIIASLDTKWKEVQFLKKLIMARGHRVLLVDVSMGGDSPIRAEISCSDVAAAGGADIETVRDFAFRERAKASEIMGRGAIRKARELLKAGQLDGIMGIGGASNATLATNVMKSLPFGIPKLMATSVASVPAYAGSFVGTSDITLMHSVVDISGSNELVQNVLKRAAGAICGMVETDSDVLHKGEKRKKPLIALTEFGFCETAGKLVMKYLEEKGFEVVAFHAQGIGDQAMEDLIMQGFFDGIIDLVPAGVSEALLGGNRAAGPHRLEAAGKMGIPQVVTPCGFDMRSCGPFGGRDRGADSLWTSKEFSSRKLYIIDELRVQVRTTKDEVRKIARVVAEKLNKAKGPVKFLIPLQGWSALSKKGLPLCDPEVDRAFTEELKLHIKPEIEIQELDCDINSVEFAKAAVESLIEMMKNEVLSRG